MMMINWKYCLILGGVSRYDHQQHTDNDENKSINANHLHMEILEWSNNEREEINYNTIGGCVDIDVIHGRWLFKCDQLVVVKLEA